MEILNKINDDEVIELNLERSPKKLLLNSIMANIMYIILWIGFDVFFIYIMTKESVSQQYWFIMVPVCGFNLIKIWVYALKTMKDISEIKHSGYALTNKAFYYYSNGKYKELKRIEFKDIVVLEKSEYMFDGFYVASLDKHIHVNNINDMKEMFEELQEKILKN